MKYYKVQEFFPTIAPSKCTITWHCGSVLNDCFKMVSRLAHTKLHDRASSDLPHWAHIDVLKNIHTVGTF